MIIKRNLEHKRLIIKYINKSLEGFKNIREVGRICTPFCEACVVKNLDDNCIRMINKLRNGTIGKDKMKKIKRRIRYLKEKKEKIIKALDEVDERGWTI